MDKTQYEKAMHEIINAVTRISLEHEISQGDTVAILTYMIHDILHLE
jgi:hypothetical protein